MDGIHDLGGKLGFGPIAVTHDDEPPFHAPWEGRLWGITRAISRPPDWNAPKFRHTRELEAPVLYLTRPYLDQWYKAYACMLVGSGLITVAELAAGKSDGTKLTGFLAPMSADDVARIKHKNKTARSDQTDDAKRRYNVGEAVVARNVSPTDHSRLPAYVRGYKGVITAYHGEHSLDDAAAHGEMRAEPLYTVRFKLSDLFPERKGSADRVHLELWESHLDDDR